jgi:tetratricopeptide (TPR) repeat protein
LAKVLTAQERFDDALALIEQTRQEANSNAAGPVQGMAFVRADLLARRGQNREAEEAFREEIRFFPRDRQTYANLALLLMTERRAEEARELLQQLARRNPSRRTYLFAARTLETLGDRRTAAEWQRRADGLPGDDS